MRKMKTMMVGFVLAIMFGSAFAQQCAKPEVAGCWELVVLNAQWDPSNPLMKDLDKRAIDGEDRQKRAQFLGPQIWHAQHAGTVRQAGPRSFIVMMWNVNPSVSDAQVTGYKMNAAKTQAGRIVPENVTGKIVPPKSDLGAPQRVYRIQADGISTSLQFPWELVTDKTIMIVCAEDKLGVYPNKVTLNQGHLINSESFAWLRNKGSVRGLMPFLSTQ